MMLLIQRQKRKDLFMIRTGWWRVLYGWQAGGLQTTSEMVAAVANNWDSKWYMAPIPQKGNQQGIWNDPKSRLVNLHNNLS